MFHLSPSLPPTLCSPSAVLFLVGLFSAAESDFETHLVDRGIEQRAWIGCIRVAEIQREMRQQMFDQVGLMIAEFVPFAPSEKRSVTVLGSLV